METIDRNFKPSAILMGVLLLIGLVVSFFLYSLAGSLAGIDSHQAAGATGMGLIAYFSCAVIVLFLTCATRLHLHSDGESLEARILILGRMVFRRAASGTTWHPVATAGRAQAGHGIIEGKGAYRIEVTNDQGVREPFLGPVICWFFRIEGL